MAPHGTTEVSSADFRFTGGKSPLWDRIHKKYMRHMDTCALAQYDTRMNAAGKHELSGYLTIPLRRSVHAYVATSDGGRGHGCDPWAVRDALRRWLSAEQGIDTRDAAHANFSTGTP